MIGICIHAQEFCGTPEPEDHILPTRAELKAEILRLESVNKMEPRVFMLSAFIVKSEAGTLGLSESVAMSAIEKMNNDYLPMNIRFELCNGFQEIRDNRYVSLEVEERASLIGNNVPNTINIYFVPDVKNSSGNGICGNATFTTSASPQFRRILMDNNCVSNGSTLSHEMGHFFDLLHTHSTFYGQERVDRVNCDNTGDGFCDTPADPRLSGLVSGACDYIGTEVDNFGKAYEPDPSLFMRASDEVKVEQFQDTEDSFVIKGGVLNSAYPVGYRVYLMKKSAGNDELIAEGTVELDGVEEFNVSYSLPFRDQFYQYESVRIELDEENVWQETEEDNNSLMKKIVHEYTIEDPLLVFPSLTADQLNLYLKRPGFEDIEIRIFNNGGQLMKEEKLRKKNTYFNMSYDVTSLLPGIYYIHVLFEDGETEIGKFVKM